MVICIMEMSGFDPTDPRVRLEVANERLRYEEEKVRQLVDENGRVNKKLGEKENELNRLREVYEQLNIKWNLAERDLQHLREKSDTQRTAAKGRAFYANLLLALASGLTGWGISLLTSTTPDPVGWIMIAAAAVLYIIGYRFTTLLA